MVDLMLAPPQSGTGPRPLLPASLGQAVNDPRRPAGLTGAGYCDPPKPCRLGFGDHANAPGFSRDCRLTLQALETPPLSGPPENQRSPRMNARLLSAVALAAVAIAAAPVINWTPGSTAAVFAQSADAPAVSVPVAKVLVRRLAPTVRFIGYLEASHIVDITPRIAGLLASALVPEGERVEEGALLFRIDPTHFELKVAQARAVLGRALALLEQASGEHARLSSLAVSGTASRKTLEAAHADKVSREADVAAARAALAEAELLLSYTEIRSPIAGIADRIRIHPGNQVAAGSSDVLTRIVSTDELFVTFHIDEANFVRIEEQDPSNLTVQVDVVSAGGVQREGVLDFRAAEFDRSNGTVRARAVIGNEDGLLKPGMFVRVRVPVAAPSDAVLVAESAIHTAAGGRYVLVVDANGVVHQRPVTLGMPEGNLRVISDGLSAGDRIVLKGLVFPGMTVDPQPAPMLDASTEPGRNAS